jgi:hypothetical protein
MEKEENIEKKSFLVYYDFINNIDELSKEEVGEIFINLLYYVNGREVKIKDRLLRIIFGDLKRQIDRDSAKWEETRKRRSEAGRKGGIAKASNAKQSQANLAVTVTDNVTDNVTGTDNEIREGYCYLIDKHIQKEEVKNDFIRYLELREQRGYPIDDDIVYNLIFELKSLADKSPSNAIRIINRAINGAYKNFAPLKDEAKNLPSHIQPSRKSIQGGSYGR